MAVVEATCLLPVFLCAMACFVICGQMMLISSEIQGALVQTAREQAQVMLAEGYGKTGSSLQTSFQKYYQETSLCRDMIVGGREGISLRRQKEGDYCRISADYALAAGLPFFRGIRLHRETAAESRIFSGFTEHGTDGGDGDRIVYVAEYGTVYHNRPDCSHICLTIRGGSRIEDVIRHNHYHACERCTRQGGTPSVIYVTPSGESYHEQLTCSGLKRTVRAVRLKEVGGMRCCMRCAQEP